MVLARQGRGLAIRQGWLWVCCCYSTTKGGPGRAQQGSELKLKGSLTLGLALVYYEAFQTTSTPRSV